MSKDKTWVPMGSFEVVADDTGKIIAHIQVGMPASPLQPMDAVVHGKSIGKYISISKAKAAIERALGFHRPGDESGINALVDKIKRMRDA